MEAIDKVLEQTPIDSRSVDTFLSRMFSDDVGKAIYVSLDANNLNIVTDFLKTNFNMDSADSNALRQKKFFSAIHEALSESSHHDIERLPQELQDVISVYGVALGLCNSLDSDDVRQYREILQKDIDDELESIRTNISELQKAGELAPSMNKG